MSTELNDFGTKSIEVECDICRTKNLPGRGLLLGRIRVNAASDDFVIFGCFKFFVRIVQILSLLVAFFVFHFRQDDVKMSSSRNETQEEELATPCASNSLISAMLIGYTLVCNKLITRINHVTQFTEHEGLLIENIFFGL